MKINFIFSKIIVALLIIVFLFIFYNTITEVEGPTTFLVVKLVKILLLISGFMLLTRYITNSAVSSSIFLICIIILSFGLRFWWIYNVDTEPVSDFDYMLKTAFGFLNGDMKSIYNNHYFLIAPDNISFTLYETAVLYFFKTVMALKIFNVIFSTAIVYFIYSISKTISSEKIARVTSLLAALFPPLIIYNSVLTNQTLSIFFIVWAIYAYVKKANLIYVGLLLAAANLIRPTAIVYLIGLLVFLLLNSAFLKEAGVIKKMRNAALDSIKLIVPYFLLIFIVSMSLQATGIIKQGLFYNPIPNYKILVGLNQETLGKYSESDNKLTANLETYKEESRLLIAERLEDTEMLMTLLSDKFYIMWSKADAGISWSLTSNIKNPEPVRFVILFEQYFYLSMITFGLFFLLKLLFSATVAADFYILFCITLLGFVFIYLFIEIQTRYRYEIYPLFIFLAGAGIMTIQEKIQPKEPHLERVVEKKQGV